MTLFEFLDVICSHVKYKSIHNAIRQEVGAHIEDAVSDNIKAGMDKSEAVRTAVSAMGNADEIGQMFNKQYRLPFNNRFGLALWAAIVTMIIYAVYPFIYTFWKSKIVPYPYCDFIVLGIIFLFMLLNVLYLRRGRKIISIRDMLYVTIGFLTGYALSCIILVTASRLLTAGIGYDNMYYAYMPEVRLLFAPPYIPFLPINITQNMFAMQGFCWWLCVVVYVAAVKTRKEVKPSFILNCLKFYNIRDGKWAGNFNEFAEGYTADGKHITPAGNVFFGLRVNKYGEQIKDMRDDNDTLI